jgi:SAM-dependent methyltransferase
MSGAAAVRHGPAQLRSYDVADPLTHGVRRGEWLLDALAKANVPLGRRLLDVGCGYGGISLAYARGGRTAFAMDIREQNLSVVRSRTAKGEAVDGTIVPLGGSALEVPLREESVDLVLLIGVLEWVGYSRRTGPVSDLQRRALRECARVVRPGGRLVIGTKNRLFPRYLWSDAQVRKPIVNGLPHGVAHLVSRILWGEPYRSRIYSLWGWRRLIAQAGLTVRDVYVPVFNYQFPLVLRRPWQAAALDEELRRRASDLSDDLRRAAIDLGHPRRGAYYSAASRLGLLGAAGGSFLLICSRQADSAC